MSANDLREALARVVSSGSWRDEPDALVDRLLDTLEQHGMIGWRTKPNGLNYPVVLGAKPMFPARWDRVLVLSWSVKEAPK